MSDQTTATPEATSTPAPAATLQIADILSAAQIIQLAGSRGAFSAEEFSDIGGTFDRLTAFLKASGAIVEAPADNTAPSDTPVA